MTEFKSTLAVFLGGGFGAAARYLLAGAIHGYFGAAFPYGTFFVNVLGCFLIGILMTTFEERFLLDPMLRSFLTIGILGGFTTFSTFSYESMELLREGSFAPFALNVAGTLAACLGATWLGSELGRII